MPRVQSIPVDKFEGLDLRRLPAATTANRLLATKNVELKTGSGLRTRTQLRLFALLSTDSVGLYTVGDGLRAAYPMTNETIGPIPQAPLGIRYDVFSNQSTYDLSWLYPFDKTVLRVDNIAVWQGRTYLNLARNVGDGTTKNEHHYCPLAETIPLPGTIDAIDDQVFTVDGPIPSTIKVGATIYFGGLTSAFTIDTITGQDIRFGDGEPDPLPELNTFYVAQVRPHEKTLVATPFAPGRALILASEKIWANDIDTNDTWFSSTINGPTDWTNPGDAGFIPTSKHVSGNQIIQGFGIYNSQLTVFYNHALQVWHIAADPADHALTGNVGGAGTQEARSVANVMGDVFYFSEGGFRSVKATVVTGQLKEGDIGAPIQPLTKTFDPLTQNMLSVWSESRSQYISIVGTTAYVLTYSPTAQLAGWTTWTIPWEVSDIAEAAGELYFRRSGTGEVYIFDPDFTEEPDFEWTARPSYVDAGNMNVKHWLSMQLVQDGTCSIYAYTNPRDPSADPEYLGKIQGIAEGIGLFAVNVVSNRLSLEFRGDSPWELDSFTVQYRLGNLG